MKKTWEAPKLIILARSRQEEAVLQICKYPANPFMALAPLYMYVICQILLVGCSMCQIDSAS